jgi:hypothetical protein
MSIRDHTRTDEAEGKVDSPSHPPVSNQTQFLKTTVSIVCKFSDALGELFNILEVLFLKSFGTNNWRIILN